MRFGLYFPPVTRRSHSLERVRASSLSQIVTSDPDKSAESNQQRENRTTLEKGSVFDTVGPIVHIGHVLLSATQSVVYRCWHRIVGTSQLHKGRSRRPSSNSAAIHSALAHSVVTVPIRVGRSGEKGGSVIFAIPLAISNGSFWPMPAGRLA